jgi:hypothetical protein
MDLENIRVPVILKNQLPQTTKECFILRGFHEIYSKNDDKHQLVMRISIIKQLTDILEKKMEKSSEKRRKMSSIFSELRIRRIDLGKRLINAEATKFEEKSSIFSTYAHNG